MDSKRPILRHINYSNKRGKKNKANLKALRNSLSQRVKIFSSHISDKEKENEKPLFTGYRVIVS
jgi:hypothetical protein